MDNKALPPHHTSLRATKMLSLHIKESVTEGGFIHSFKYTYHIVEYFFLAVQTLSNIKRPLVYPNY